MRCFFGISLNDYSKEFSKINLPKESEMSKAKEYHITLIFYEDLPNDKIKLLKEKLKNFSFHKFKLEGDKLVAFPDKSKPELYALGFKSDSKLKELYKKIKDVIYIEAADKFNPHLTLLRKEKLSQNFKEFKEEYSRINPIKIEIGSLGLYKSEPDRGMNSYTPLFTVKLR